MHLSRLGGPVAVPVAATRLPGERKSLFPCTLLRRLVRILDGKAGLIVLVSRLGIPVRATSRTKQHPRGTAGERPPPRLLKCTPRRSLLGTLSSERLVFARPESFLRILRGGSVNGLGVFGRRCREPGRRGRLARPLEFTELLLNRADQFVGMVLWKRGRNGWAGPPRRKRGLELLQQLGFEIGGQGTRVEALAANRP